MVTLAQRLGAMGNDDALRLVAQVRPQLLVKVTELRNVHLKNGVELSDKSRDSYRGDALRVSAAGGDPRDLAGTAASFRKLRAACAWTAKEELRETLARADRIRKKNPGAGDIAALCIYADDIPAIEQRLAFLAELKFDGSKAVRREKTHQQRSKLGRLPDEWINRVHSRTRGGKYGHTVAVSALIPIRPDEIASRVKVKLDGDDLIFEVKGSKVQDKGAGVAAHVLGIGQSLRILRLSAVDHSRAAVFEWLKNEVAANGGRLTVGAGLTAAGISSAFRAMSKREFPGLSSPPSIYALRHEACAELKASGIGAQNVAKGMGHASERSQAAYGTRSQGRGGYVVEAWASDAVRSQRPSAGPPARLKVKAQAKSVQNRAKGPRGP